MIKDLINYFHKYNTEVLRCYIIKCYTYNNFRCCYMDYIWKHKIKLINVRAWICKHPELGLIWVIPCTEPVGSSKYSDLSWDNYLISRDEIYKLSLKAINERINRPENGTNML